MKLQHLRSVFIRNLHIDQQDWNPDDPPAYSDSFISICTLLPAPKLLYVSEVCLSDPNPVFQIVVPPLPVHRSNSRVCVCLYVRRDSWTLLAEYRLSLRKLVALDDRLDTLHERYDFAANCLLLYIDGMYYALPGTYTAKPNKSLVDATLSYKSPSLPSYTFEAVRSITRLTRSVDELCTLKLSLAKQIAALESHSQLKTDFLLERAAEDLSSINHAIESHRADCRSLQVRIESLKLDKETQAAEIARKSSELAQDAANQLDLAASQIDAVSEILNGSLRSDIVAQVRKHALSLSRIFPIVNIPNTARFTILGIEMGTVDEIVQSCAIGAQSINAGLSYVVQLTNALAEVCNATLRYPMEAKGNESMIRKDDEMLPLHYTEEGFSKGLALLCDNVVQLAHAGKVLRTEACSIPEDCMDSVLWMLRYVLLFVTDE